MGVRINNVYETNCWPQAAYSKYLSIQYFDDFNLDFENSPIIYKSHIFSVKNYFPTLQLPHILISNLYLDRFYLNFKNSSQNFGKSSTFSKS